MKWTLRTLASVVGAAVMVFAAMSHLRGSAQGTPTGQLTLRIIVVSSQEAAERVLARLKAGESFALVAQAESTHPAASRGGWIGLTLLDNLREDVRRALQGVAPGALSPIVRLPTGFAIFKVEPDEAPGTAVLPSAPGLVKYGVLASSGNVKYVFDLGGVNEERTGFNTDTMPPGWRSNLHALCEARTATLNASRSSVDAFLAGADSGQAIGTADPIDVVQLLFGLGQLYAYRGEMASAVARFEKGLEYAKAKYAPALAQMEQALGVAHLHKALLDNHVNEQPGDYCLLEVKPPPAYPVTVDAQKSVDHLLKLLELKPQDLEARWLLNLAYRALGTYPAAVPPQFLIPPDTFASAEDVGRFRDVAKVAGLDNVASAGGLLVDDFNGDGRPDVVTSTLDNCRAMRFFINNGDGTFTDRTAAAGLATQYGGLNLVRADYNNDGCPDILVLRGGWEYLPQRKSLLRNNCNGTFTDVTEQAGLTEPTSTQTAAWADIDNDGWLDVFVGNESGPPQLFHNKRDGTFEDIAEKAGVKRTSYTKGVTAIDYDNDRYPDLYVSNFGEQNFLYHNNRNGTFTEFAEAARVLGTPTGFATWFFDYDNDGLPDLFVTSYVVSIDEMVRDYLKMPHNGTTMKLYKNLGDGTFRDVSAQVGFNKVLMPMGSNFGDIDNDGFLDIYLGTGNPSYGALAPSVLLRNKNGQQFVDVTSSSGTGELHKGHGVAFADLDNDGDEEIVFEVGGALPGDRHALRLFENPGHGSDWITVKLVGKQSNRDAIGARIRVTVNGQAGAPRAIYRTVGEGGSFGVSPIAQHIGLGKDARKVDLEIWWPVTDRRQQFSNVPKNTVLRIQEGDGALSVSRPEPVRLGGRAAR